MPSKLDFYSQMADRTARQVTGSFGEWTTFLETMGRLYKYPFHEQLMIFAQKPNATACADYDLWNKQMGRYVRRGTKGIALIDTSGDNPRLKYVFDVSDTGGREMLSVLSSRGRECINRRNAERYGTPTDRRALLTFKPSSLPVRVRAIAAGLRLRT